MDVGAGVVSGNARRKEGRIRKKAVYVSLRLA